MAKPGDPVKAFTNDAKVAVQMAFEGIGGIPALIQWANNPANQGQFYTQIWSKIIPKDIKSEVSGQDGGPVKLSISWQNSIEDAVIADGSDTVDDSLPVATTTEFGF